MNSLLGKTRFNSLVSVPIRLLTALVFPHYCPGCGEEWEDGTGFICPSCWETLPFPAHSPWNADLRLKERVFVGYAYQDVMRDLVHHMKFYGRTDIAPILGAAAAERLAGRLNELGTASVIPIPLHPIRVRERGYDQNLSVARGVAVTMNWKLRRNALRRIRNTRPQSQLSNSERQTNLAGAFEACIRRDAMLREPVLLVDDVIHTGATAAGCMEVLRSVGIEDVYVLAGCG